MNKRKGLQLLVFSLILLAATARLSSAQSQDMPMITEPVAKTASPNAKLPEYDVVSVRENKSEQHMMRMMFKPEGFSGTNLSLRNLIAYAYGIKQDLITGGPGWVSTTGFDVEAKVAPEDVDLLKNLPPPRRQSMLRPALADRFKLQVHTETKVLPTYDLVVVKGSSKLTESVAVTPDPNADKNQPPKGAGMMRMSPGELTVTANTMKALADQLSYTVHRTVNDQTGLTAKYDFKLTWTPEDAPADADHTGPSIFTALQEQLGLKLVPSKGPVETLVIDHAEMPSEN